MLTGTLWYGQFFFYNLGHVRMSNANTSWAIHMIMLVLFSNLVARRLPRMERLPAANLRSTIALGLAVLIAVGAGMTYGNYLGDDGLAAALRPGSQHCTRRQP